MKINLFTTFVTLLLLLTLSPTNTLAQDYTKWELPEGAKLRLGKGIVTDIQISPDNTRLAIASSAGVWLYDVNTSNEIALFSREYKHKVEETIPQVVFSPDSRKLASSGYDDTIQIWNTKTGKHLLTVSMPVGPAQLFKFLTDGTWSTTIIPADEVESFKFLPDHKTQSITIIFSGPLKSFKFLPDSKALVIQNSSGTVWLWDITTGKQFVNYSPRLPKPGLGKYKTWLQMDNFADPNKWKLATDTFVDLTGGVTFAFAVGDKEGTISIQDESTHQQIRTFTGSTNAGLSLPIQDRVRRPGSARPVLNELPTTWVKWVTELEFAPNGKTLVSRSEYRMVDHLNGGRSSRQGPTEIWDVVTGKQLAALPPYESHWSNVDIKFSEDGKTLAIIGSGGCAIWDVTTPAEIAVFDGEVDAKFTGNGKIFAVIRNNNFAIWDIAKGSQIAALSTVPERFALMPERRSAFQREGPTVATVSPDGTILAVIDKHGTVNVWKTLTSIQLRTFTTGYTKMFTTLAFAHDGKTLASGDTEGKIQLWDLNTRSTPTTLTSNAGKPIDGLAFGTDDTTLTSESDGNIETWDIRNKKQVDTYTIPGASGSSGIRTTISFKTTFVEYLSGVAALTPSGGKLAVFHDFQNRKKSEKITVWDISTGKPLCTIADVTWKDIILAFASDGKTFVTSDDSTVRLWNTYTGEQIVTLNIPAYSGAFAPDGKILAIGEKNNKTISFWNFARQECIATLEGHEYIIYQLAFSPDSTILASGDAGGVIRLWELPIGKHLTTFKFPAGYISKLAFAPDGKTLASTNGGSTFRSPVGTILLWNVPTK